MNETLDINSLSRTADVPVRTIRYYLAEGLLPSPNGRGPAASYSREHLDRLRLIRRLQDAHQPLALIKSRLAGLDPAGVAQALAEVEGAVSNEPRSAADYVRRVMARSSQGETIPETPPTHGADEAAASKTPTRSTWERITLHPDIELHVRRPLARADQRRLEALLEQAKRLFVGND
ncbi:MerR family transcriptional regulator [Thiocapsa rosea]|uniref:MerR-like DNA binding protein n=1 Tax=Thiocapsa rosea TaxID=69360 RepID=A0A495URM3_9GAMM|nr:MerR family transcriptional regulator [Thiocapsa rosea]RKT38048.1 MerR-like DNA binding protein [Thiocapsa rosea]